ncbi:MAG: hypothetical protein PHN82_04125 [bacterium]|nr:hypothetical protein [bacterium]
MKRTVCIASCVVIGLCLCAPAWARQKLTKVSQPPDLEAPWSLSATKDSIIDTVAADDWECEDGVAVTSVRWWGEYHGYKMDDPEIDGPPEIRPRHFILSWHEADPGGEPGDMIADEELLLADVSETYVTSVRLELTEADVRYIHVFRYEAKLPAPWEQEKGKVYWLDIKAVYEEDSPNQWNWLTTEPSDGLIDDAVESFDDGATWTVGVYPPDHPHEGKPLNLAFELNPFTLVVDPSKFDPGLVNIRISIRVPPVDQDFVAYVVAFLPDDTIRSFVPATAKRALRSQELTIPCVPVAGLEPIAGGTAQTIPLGADVTIFDGGVALAEGTYTLKAGFFDPAEPIRSEADAFLLTSTDVEVGE